MISIKNSIGLSKIYELKKFDCIYVIGHNNIDADSYFSSYLLSKILKKFGINAQFTILNDYVFSDADKEIINNYLKEKPRIISRQELDNKNFILVDHNDIEQSIKNSNCNVIFSIDHHIDSKKVSKCYSVEYTSTLLYIYDMFKNLYDFNNEDKMLIAISVMTDSEYLTTTRFKESDKKLYDELNVNIDNIEMQNKYFKTTDFSLDINYNIDNNYKIYNIEQKKINRLILKGYYKDRYILNNYIEKFSDLYDNTLLIWNEYDTLNTFVYYNKKLIKKYNYILTSSVLIIKDLIKNKIIK